MGAASPRRSLFTRAGNASTAYLAWVGAMNRRTTVNTRSVIRTLPATLRTPLTGPSWLAHIAKPLATPGTCTGGGHARSPRNTIQIAHGTSTYVQTSRPVHKTGATVVSTLIVVPNPHQLFSPSPSTTTRAHRPLGRRSRRTSHMPTTGSRCPPIALRGTDKRVHRRSHVLRGQRPVGRLTRSGRVTGKANESGCEPFGFLQRLHALMEVHVTTPSRLHNEHSSQPGQSWLGAHRPRPRTRRAIPLNSGEQLLSWDSATARRASRTRSVLGRSGITPSSVLHVSLPVARYDARPQSAHPSVAGPDAPGGQCVERACDPVGLASKTAPSRERTHCDEGCRYLRQPWPCRHQGSAPCAVNRDSWPYLPGDREDQT